MNIRIRIRNTCIVGPMMKFPISLSDSAADILCDIFESYPDVSADMDGNTMDLSFPSTVNQIDYRRFDAAIFAAVVRYEMDDVRDEAMIVYLMFINVSQLLGDETGWCRYDDRRTLNDFEIIESLSGLDTFYDFDRVVKWILTMNISDTSVRVLINGHMNAVHGMSEFDVDLRCRIPLAPMDLMIDDGRVIESIEYIVDELRYTSDRRISWMSPRGGSDERRSPSNVSWMGPRWIR